MRCLARLCQVDGWAGVAAKAKIYVVARYSWIFDAVDLLLTP